MRVEVKTQILDDSVSHCLMAGKLPSVYKPTPSFYTEKLFTFIRRKIFPLMSNSLKILCRSSRSPVLQAVQLESVSSVRVRYLIVVSTLGNKEESLLLGVDFPNSERCARV